MHLIGEALAATICHQNFFRWKTIPFFGVLKTHRRRSSRRSQNAVRILTCRLSYFWHPESCDYTPAERSVLPNRSTFCHQLKPQCLRKRAHCTDNQRGTVGGNQKQGSVLFCKLWFLDDYKTRCRILVLYLKFLILMWYVAGPNFRYRCDWRGVRPCKSDGALGRDPLLEVLGGLHLVVTDVVPVCGGADKKQKQKREKKRRVRMLFSVWMGN